MTIREKLDQQTGPLDVENEALDGLTPIQYAAKHGEVGYLEEKLSVLGAESKQSIMDYQTKAGGLTALHFAARAGQVGCVELLLAQGASPRPLSLLRQMPIQSALTSHNSPAVMMALFNCLNTDPSALGHANHNGDTLAHFAVQKNLVDILSVIKEQNAMVLMKKNNQSMTPLLLAVSIRATPLVEALLDSPALRVVDQEGRNALHYAARCAGVDCVERLIPYYDVNALDNNQLTAMDYALVRGEEGLIHLLTQAKAHSAAALAEKSHSKLS